MALRAMPHKSSGGISRSQSSSEYVGTGFGKRSLAEVLKEKKLLEDKEWLFSGLMTG